MDKEEAKRIKAELEEAWDKIHKLSKALRDAGWSVNLSTSMNFLEDCFKCEFDDKTAPSVRAYRTLHEQID